ncbi:MAG: hypothetical protein AB1810_09100 [Pseudomonadota bacterium]
MKRPSSLIATLIIASIIVLIAGPAAAEQVALSVDPDPAFEARYCSFMAANRFEDYALTARWTKRIKALEANKPMERLREISKTSFDLMKDASETEARAAYNQCKARIAILETGDRLAEKAMQTYLANEKAKEQQPKKAAEPFPPVPPGGIDPWQQPLPQLNLNENGILREPPAARAGEDSYACRSSAIAPVTLCYNASFWSETRAPQKEIEAFFKSPANEIQIALITSKQVVRTDIQRAAILRDAQAHASGGQYGVKVTADKTLTLDGHPWHILEYWVNLNGYGKHYVSVFTAFESAGSAQLHFTPADTDAFRPEIDDIIRRIKLTQPAR